MLEALLAILPDLKSRGIFIWVLGRRGDILPADVSHLDTMGYSDEPLSPDVRKDLTLNDISHYIFTSGTTGHYLYHVSYSGAILESESSGDCGIQPTLSIVLQNTVLTLTKTLTLM